MTTTEFYGAGGVIPWIGLGVVFNGVYLLTSIGLNITKSTNYYPVATAIAAGDEPWRESGAGAAIRAIGAAWANVGCVCGAGGGRDAIFAACVSGEV